MGQQDHKARIIGELPKHQPAPDQWGQIAARLDRSTIQEIRLPAHIPSDRVWEKVDRRLQEQGPHIRKHRWKLHWMTGAVAASILLIAGYQYLQRAHYSPENIEYSVEVHEPQPTDVDDASELNANYDRIQSQYMPEFTTLDALSDYESLNAQLEELSRSEVEIEEVLNEWGRDPELELKVIEIRKQKATLIKELIQLIMYEA